jgi:thiamine phosphate synthase YjbQ (UPF0047 family)
VHADYLRRWGVFSGIPRRLHEICYEYLTFNTEKHRVYVHITPTIEAIVRQSAIHDGMVLVSAMHITAGVYVNDDESGLIEDIDEWLENMAPYRKEYRHHQPARITATRT